VKLKSWNLMKATSSDELRGAALVISPLDRVRVSLSILRCRIGLEVLLVAGEV
jgi:hypothetical protein